MRYEIRWAGQKFGFNRWSVYDTKEKMTLGTYFKMVKAHNVVDMLNHPENWF